MEVYAALNKINEQAVYDDRQYALVCWNNYRNQKTILYKDACHGVNMHK